VNLPNALGVLVVDLAGGVHQWATAVRLHGPAGDLRLEWHEDEHPHSCGVIGDPQVVWEELHLDTERHGAVVVRRVGPEDTWRVWPAGVTAWEAIQDGHGLSARWPEGPPAQ
jgi:hypothetical protein